MSFLNGLFEGDGGEVYVGVVNVGDVCGFGYGGVLGDYVYG